MIQLRGEIAQALQDAFWFGHMAAENRAGTHDTALAERNRTLRLVAQRVGGLVMRAYLVGSAWTFLAVVGICLLARGLRGGGW